MLAMKMKILECNLFTLIFFLVANNASNYLATVTAFVKTRILVSSGNPSIVNKFSYLFLTFFLRIV